MRDRARPSAAALEALLGSDLSALVTAVGTPVVEAVLVTTIRSPVAHRASFRLTLADGNVLKGRRFEAPTVVARIAHLSALLDSRYFPPVLAHRGCALLTHWIPGRTGTPRVWTRARVRTCGRLHADLHRLHVPPDVASRLPRAPDWPERLDRWLHDLAAGGALGTREATEIGRLAAHSAPPTASTGLCHTDFCGDNIVITHDGRICVVDNENLTLDSHEYDLGRTWYRWPMTPTQARAYAEGYGAHEHSDRFADHFLYWALMALLDSAAFRMRVRAADARVPLDRLTDLVESRGRNESLPRFLSRAGGR